MAGTMRGKMLVREGACYRVTAHAARLAALVLTLVFGLASSASAQDVEFGTAAAPSDTGWSLLLFGGALHDGELADVVKFQGGFEDTGFVGAALARELYRNDFVSVEAEGGLGHQFGGGNDTTQVWAALYGRWHAFPWNHIVRTSVAGSLGVNYQFSDTPFEIAETTAGTSKKLLHYFSPEITFGLPERPNEDLVFRVHHRSSFFEAFGCDGCGSNVVTVGLRKRF